MKEVKIYIETSLAGPCVKDGWYAAVLECQTEKGPATKGFVGMEEKTTYNRSTLLAMVEALKKLKPCRVLIYTNCAFVINTFENGRLEDWRRAEWHKASGEEVKNKELWKQFLEEGKRMEKIGFRFSKHHDYRPLLKEMIAEEQNRSRETAEATAGKP
ncbi:hypothetical protein FND36_10290 [Lachnospiraceae bacterium KGMB03038]|nr:hypothetical protein FND36_10290 [Lachnospiraceae bacterium KGMB03038]